MKKIFLNFVFATLVFTIQAQEVKWYSIEEAFELNKTQPRKFMVDVYTDWCGWCKVMDQKTFSNEVIAAYLNEKYYAVKFNAEQKEDIILGTDTLKFVAQGRRGYHELAAALLNNKLSYPSVVFLDEQVRILHLQQGFTKAEPFDRMLKFFGGNYYATQNWETWSSNYESPIKLE